MRKCYKVTYTLPFLLICNRIVFLLNKVKEKKTDKKKNETELQVIHIIRLKKWQEL